MRPNDGRAVPTFVRQALEGKPLTVFGDGTQTRSFCYVDDLIRGLVAARRVGRAPAGEHRQPARVHAQRARARRSCASRARRARSSTRRCRSTTRRCASPTSRARSSSSAGSRRSSSRKGCGACCRASDGSRSLRRHIGVFAATALVAAGLARARCAGEAAYAHRACRTTRWCCSATRRSRSGR